MDWFNKLLGQDKPPVIDNITEIEQNKILIKSKYDDIPFFNLKGHRAWAKCVKVYDGDTGTFVFFFNGKPFKWRVRLAGIDTAELKTDNKEEHEFAVKTRARFEEYVKDKLIYIECLGWDKYGRLLANIYPDNVSKITLNSQLMSEGFAYAYDGGSRVPFDKWKNGKLSAAQPAIDKINDSEILEPVGFN